MITICHQPETAEQDWRDSFLHMLPQIESRLTAEFRYLDPEARDEAVQEGIANSFAQYERLARQNRTGVATAASLARFAARQVRGGRTVGTKLDANEPLSRYAQLQKRFRVETLDRWNRAEEEWVQPLIEDRRTSIPEQVAFRVDVPEWLSRFAQRTRRIARDLAMGWTTGEVARRHGLSAGRISQLRSELHDSWRAFQHTDADIG